MEELLVIVRANPFYFDLVVMGISGVVAFFYLDLR